MAATLPLNISDTQQLLLEQNYVASFPLATSVHLAINMQRPLLLEGEPGVGKTELARSLAEGLGGSLVRLQCYEGLDVSSAAYEWNYSRQLLHIRAQEATGENLGTERIEQDIYADEFLLRRPLLQALTPREDGKPTVLLIDELDRADEPFEAFLLEVLADYQFTVPELGTIRAEIPPITILTSNRTRDIHDAIRRRCLYHWLDYPDPSIEQKILNLRVPETAGALGKKIVQFVEELRREDLLKSPGIAETIDWANALITFDLDNLSAEGVRDTLGALLKHRDDLDEIDRDTFDRLVSNAEQASSAA